MAFLTLTQRLHACVEPVADSIGDCRPRFSAAHHAHAGATPLHL
jgi:hypothetical protein